MSITVTVKTGLSFACPRCGRIGLRFAPSSDVFAAPPGHTVLYAETEPGSLIRCHFGQADLDWSLRFADVQESDGVA
jgi:hypothetical protein